MVNPNWTRCQKAASVNEASIPGIFLSLTVQRQARQACTEDSTGKVRANLLYKSIDSAHAGGVTLQTRIPGSIDSQPRLAEAPPV